MEKKYELIKENPFDFHGRKLYRVRALKDFSDVKKGDIGGYVQSENNLSQEENCWVYNNAIVSENARVYDNTVIGGNARVYDNAKVHGNAEVNDDAKVYGYAIVRDNA